MIKVFPASILAQYLADNDKDGIADNQLIVDKLIDKKAWLLMADNEDEAGAAN